MEKIDDSICSGIEQDDERAWAAFYAAFAPVMRAYAVRRGCDEPDDAVQDVFVKFVSAVRSGGFQARSAAETCSYLKTQVVRQVIDYHRRAKARCRDATVKLDGIEIAVPAVVRQIVEAREEAEIGARARARVVSGWRCTDRTRAIFEACTIGGRSAAEVAREFGVSPGFVRIIRHRGLANERAEKKFAQRV
jgi:RNA polymerase sigma factor (sigma-70 family)